MTKQDKIEMKKRIDKNIEKLIELKKIDSNNEFVLNNSLKVSGKEKIIRENVFVKEFKEEELEELEDQRWTITDVRVVITIEKELSIQVLKLDWREGDIDHASVKTKKIKNLKEETLIQIDKKLIEYIKYKTIELYKEYKRQQEQKELQKFLKNNFDLNDSKNKKEKQRTIRD